MTRQETVLQYAKVLLLSAILAIALGVHWSGTTNAQTAAAQGFQYKHITTATSTVVAGASVTLHAVVVGTGVASSTATIYDNTACSGTVISVLSTAASGSFNYDIQTATGLCVTTSGATDITVAYR